jgi:membrane protease subunit HflK
MAVHEAYRTAPEVTRQRMYLETMTKVLPRVGRKFYMEDDARGVIPLFGADDLSRAAGRARVGGIR